MRILVADDDPTSRLIARTVLQALGHHCETVADGEEAWEAYRRSRPEVIISDSMMPRLSGLDLCRRIRADDTGTYIYFIILTSFGDPEQILTGMRAGADDYLVKPLATDDLQARLIAAERVTALHGQLESQRSELRRLNDELVGVSRRDPLTGLGNRRALGDDLELLEARTARYGHRYCMALLDVDLFKTYNDTYGHPAGDEVLREVAAQLTQEARAGDALYRYGGEEFLCIFAEQSLESGVVAVERMRAGLQHRALPHGGNPVGVLTVSAGLAVLDPERPRLVSDVLKEADEALYRAKALGRNRVEPAVATGVVPA
jgi:two-component system cell cycle response regulator